VTVEVRFICSQRPSRYLTDQADDADPERVEVCIYDLESPPQMLRVFLHHTEALMLAQRLQTYAVNAARASVTADADEGEDDEDSDE